MSGYVDVAASDKYTLNNSYNTVTTVSSDIMSTGQVDSIKVGANDAYAISPFQASAVLNYTIPDYLIQGMADICKINKSLLEEIGNRELAIVCMCRYLDETFMSPDGVVSNRMLTSLNANYISKDTDCDGIPNSYILNTDFSNARICSLTDTNGNPISIASGYQEIRNKAIKVENNTVDYTACYGALLTNSDVLISKVDSLYTCFAGYQASIEQNSGIFAGIQREWNSCHPLWESCGADNPPLGVICYNNGRQYRYINSTIKWVALDAVALETATTCFNTANGNINALSGVVKNNCQLLDGKISDSLLKASRTLRSSPSEPSTAGWKKYDIWVDTDAFYPGDVGNSYINKIKVFNGTRLGPNDNPSDANTSYASCDCAKTVVGWAAYSDHLIKGANGAITGWSMLDGSNMQSQFRIAANCFVISSGEATDCLNAKFCNSFSIVDPGNSTPLIKFNGIVSFSNSNMMPYLYTPVFGVTYSVNFENPIPVNENVISTYGLQVNSPLIDSDGTKYSSLTNTVAGSYIHLKNTQIIGSENPVIRLLLRVPNPGTFRGYITYNTEVYNPVTKLYNASVMYSKTAQVVSKFNTWTTLDITPGSYWGSANSSNVRIKDIMLYLHTDTVNSTIHLRSIEIGGGITNSADTATSTLSNVTTISGGKINTNELVFGGELKDSNGAAWKAGASGMYLDKNGISIIANGKERIRIGKLI